MLSNAIPCCAVGMGGQCPFACSPKDHLSMRCVGIHACLLRSFGCADIRTSPLALCDRSTRFGGGRMEKQSMLRYCYYNSILYCAMLWYTMLCCVWHNQLCHSSPDTIHNAHKRAKGVPKFSGDACCPISDHCPTCTRAKLTRAMSGKHRLDLCTMPCNVISLDFSFAGIVSKVESRREDVVGINGEVRWILAEDQFSKILHVDT